MEKENFWCGRQSSFADFEIGISGFERHLIEGIIDSWIGFNKFERHPIEGIIDSWIGFVEMSGYGSGSNLEYFRKHELSPQAPLEQSYLSYNFNGWPDHCQEKAGNPTQPKLPMCQFPTGFDKFVRHPIEGTIDSRIGIDKFDRAKITGRTSYYTQPGRLVTCIPRLFSGGRLL